MQSAASRGNALAGRAGALMHVSRGRASGPAGLRGALVLLACCALALQGRRAAGQFVGIDFNSPARLVFGATQLAEALLDQAISRVVIHGAPWDACPGSEASAHCAASRRASVCAPNCRAGGCWCLATYRRAARFAQTSCMSAHWLSSQI